MEKDFDYYEDLIEKNQLPDDFNQWLMEDEYGNTLAHSAAYEGILPPGWTDKTEDWLIKNNDGATIAHLAAGKSILPPDWTDKTENWLVRGCNGETIAHNAAESGILPPDWTNDPKDWLTVCLLSKSTIAHRAALNGVLPDNWTKNPDDWLIQNINNKTIGFFNSVTKDNHYNNPKTIEDYCKNMINHIFPLVDKKCNFDPFSIDYLYNFVTPFLESLKKAKHKELIETSEHYSGFLIDYIESILDKSLDYLLIEINNVIENIDQELDHEIYDKLKSFRENLRQTEKNVLNEKMKIKEHLFKQHESKNQSIIKDNEDKPDFLDTL